MVKEGKIVQMKFNDSSEKKSITREQYEDFLETLRPFYVREDGSFDDAGFDLRMLELEALIVEEQDNK